MKWLKRKVIKWVRESWEEENKKSRDGVSLSVYNRDESNHPDSDPVLTFRIYSAQNGKILEFKRYDRVKDRNDITTYIIGKDEDIAEKVSKCVTLEAMK